MTRASSQRLNIWRAEKRKEAIECQVVTDHELGRLRPELESTLYRIAQEGLVNAVKHSRSPKGADQPAPKRQERPADDREIGAWDLI